MLCKLEILGINLEKSGKSSTLPLDFCDSLILVIANEGFLENRKKKGPVPNVWQGVVAACYGELEKQGPVPNVWQGVVVVCYGELQGCDTGKSPRKKLALAEL